MKDLESVLKLLVAALVGAVVLAAVLTGRAAVRSHYEYKQFVAPRTLNQMVLEMEADKQQDRSSTLLFGAGLMAICLLGFGGFVLYTHQRTALLKETRLGRRKKSQRPRLPTLPMVMSAPLLGDEPPRADRRRLPDGDLK